MLHIIQNDREVPPGNIAKNLRDMGIPVRVCHPYRDEPLPLPEETAGVIVLGGAMCANDEPHHPFLMQVKEFIRETVAHGIPYLGVCLGGQLLAAAMGGKVVANRWGELGMLEVELTESGMGTACLRGSQPGMPPSSGTTTVSTSLERGYFWPLRRPVRTRPFASGRAPGASSSIPR